MKRGSDFRRSAGASTLRRGSTCKPTPAAARRRGSVRRRAGRSCTTPTAVSARGRWRCCWPGTGSGACARARSRARLAATLLGDLDPEARLASWHLISPAGERSSGGAALGPLLGQLPGGGLGAALASAAPTLAEHAYRWVADHRSALSGPLPAGAKRRARASGQAGRSRARTRPAPVTSTIDALRRQVPRLQGLAGGRDARPPAAARRRPRRGRRGRGRPARDQHLLHHAARRRRSRASRCGAR